MSALANISFSLGSDLVDASLLHQSFATNATSRRAPSRLTYALEQRQVCFNAGYSPCQGFPQNCCPTGTTCCEYGGVIIGCCAAGSQCAFDAFGNRVCITGSCASQGRVQCTNFQACCPAGTDCLDVGGTLKCAPPQAPPPPPPPPPQPSPSPPPAPPPPQPQPQPSPQPQPQPQPPPSPPPSQPSPPPPPAPAPSPPNMPTPSPNPAPTPDNSNSKATSSPQADNAPASSFPVSTVRSAPASQQSQPSSLFQLASCAPCGSQKCTFNPEDSTTTTYTVIVGTPVENCDGTSGNITLTVGGSTTFEDSWSIAVEDLGLDFFGVSSSVTTSWEQSKGLEYQQSVQVDVAPGFMTALVAKVQYKQTSGSISIGSNPKLPILSNQPVKVVAYGAQTTTCSGKFDAASNSSTPQCSSAVTAKRLGSVHVALLWSLFLTSLVTSILL